MGAIYLMDCCGILDIYRLVIKQRNVAGVRLQ